MRNSSFFDCRTRLLGSLGGLLISLGMSVQAAATPSSPQAGDEDDEEGRTRPETEITVTARRLDVARESVEPSLGASTYTLTNEVVENRPGGETTNLGHILLHVPGVAQGGSGRLLIRGSRGGLQYRINNVIIPEGMSDLGERLSTRLAERVQLITGALPAQYGLSAGGVVGITTKSGALLRGGQAEIYGGSHDEIEPAFEIAGSHGPTSVFASGSYLHTGLGLGSPDGSAHPLHDRADELEGFLFADHIFDDRSRLSLIFGTSNEAFQIPDARGLNALGYRGSGGFQRPLVARGLINLASEALDGRLRENSHYGILSYLRSSERATVQASIFARSSTANSRPDYLGSLLFAGISDQVRVRDRAAGLQLEGVYRPNDRHAVRGGVVLSLDSGRTRISSLVLPVDGQGRQTSDQPIAFVRNPRERRLQASGFLQDEWKVLERLTLNAGVRVDWVDSISEGARLSPRLSLVWAGPAETTVHAGYARYFVPPPGDDEGIEALAGTTGAPPGASGSPLRAETDDYYDLGIQQSLAGLTIGLDAYWREAGNLIGERMTGPPLISRTFNYDRGRLRGVEFSLTYAHDEFAAWSSIAVAAGRGRGIVSHQYYFTAEELRAIDGRWVALEDDQKVTASGGASYRLGALLLSSDFLYGSGLRRTSPGVAHLPDHFQLDLAAVYHLDGLGGRPIDIRFDATNLLDAEYQLVEGSGIGAHLPEWGPRRGLFIGLEQSF